MSARKTERLLNLVIALLSTRRPLSARAIRDRVNGYEGQSDDAFERMFERDKAELRDLGVPLTTEVVDHWTEEVGYLIPRGSYELPEVELTAEEAAAVGLAVRFWRSGEVSAAVSSARRKLVAAGVEVQDVVPAGLEPVVHASEPALPVFWRALDDRVAVRFGYRRTPTAKTETRTLEPWGIVCWHGRWYAGGHDRARGESRTFRLDRVVGQPERVGPAPGYEIPPGTDVLAMVEARPSQPLGEAVVRVRPGGGHELRRAATAVDAGIDGWDVVRVPYDDLDRLVPLVARLGPDAVVDAPAEARDAVVARLRAVVAAAG